MLQGKSEGELSDEGGVTRQAINMSKIKVFEKIRAHYKLSVEDRHQISPEQMDESIETVLAIFNKEEKRRLRFKARRPQYINANPYTYAME